MRQDIMPLEEVAGKNGLKVHHVVQQNCFLRLSACVCVYVCELARVCMRAHVYMCQDTEATTWGECLHQTWAGSNLGYELSFLFILGCCTKTGCI